MPPKAYARSSRFLRVASAKSPLTLSLSPQARLGELASQRGRIRRRMRLGERTPERSSALIFGHSPCPHPLAGAAAKDASTPCRACAEKDRMRGPFVTSAKQPAGFSIIREETFEAPPTNGLSPRPQALRACALHARPPMPSTGAVAPAPPGLGTIAGIAGRWARAPAWRAHGAQARRA